MAWSDNRNDGRGIDLMSLNNWCGIKLWHGIAKINLHSGLQNG